HAYQSVALLHLAAAAGGLHHSGQTYTEEWVRNIPALLGLADASIVCERQGLLQSWLKIAGIVRQARRCGIRKGFGYDKIAAPYLSRVKRQFTGQEVDSTLHKKSPLGAASPAVGPGGWFIGDHAQALNVHRRNGVWSGHPMGGVDWWPRAGIQKVRSDIRHDAEAHPEDRAIAPGSRFHFCAVATSVIGQHIFPALLNPLDGPFQLHGEVT